MKTIICRSQQSFFDLCDNNLVSDVSVHCTFPVKQHERKWMYNYIAEKGGVNLTFTELSMFNAIFA